MKATVKSISTAIKTALDSLTYGSDSEVENEQYEDAQSEEGSANSSESQQ